MTTVRVRSPIAAFEATVTGTVIQVELSCGMKLTVTPEPEMLTYAPGTKFVPVMTRFTVLPSAALGGVTLATVGGGGSVMVNVIVELTTFPTDN